MTAVVEQLVERFKADRDYFRSDQFKEMSVRSEFLNPVLTELGWNPENTGLSNVDREVIQEDSVIIDGQEKAPDYAFYLERKRRWLLEAKRPTVSIGGGRSPAYQIRRYCWNAALPFGIVTDFEEWAVYDCRSKPSPEDPPTTGRLRYFTFDELIDNWDYLCANFGRSSVRDGSLETLALGTAEPRGSMPVDKAFLKDIESWRQTLAVDIRSRNAMDAIELNSVVQNLLDRLIFLRIAEDRGLEPFGELRGLTEVDRDTYAGLTDLFLRADDRYNSGLFHFTEADPVNGEPDSRALDLDVSEDVLDKIIARTYPPYPYDFSVMPADILGRVYEQFLGARITLDGDNVRVEEKPEVRKAGGVYYTPEPIVDYIVESTLGPLLNGATPGEVSNLTVVDPACGSGSFLIVAYQYLIDWYTDHYAGLTARTQDRYLDQLGDGSLRLKTSIRKRILIENIYGVDIDPQAVEVTKLSLLLKVIEGESQTELQVGRLLPDLGANVLCGNSLIEPDFPMPLEATAQEELDINVFSWTEGFPDVFERGGFDAVIGNPPYFSIDSTWGNNDPRLSYISSRYPSVHTDKTDILFYFIARAIEICKGEIGYIVSRSFLEADKAQNLRSHLAAKANLREVLDFREAPVFQGVGINTAIIRLTKSRAAREASFRRFPDRQLPAGYGASYLRDNSNITSVSVPGRELGSTPWIFAQGSVDEVLRKIDSAGEPVGGILHVGQGMQTGRNGAFSLKEADQSTLDEAKEEGLVLRRARNSDIYPHAIREDGPEFLYLEDVDSFLDLPKAVQAWVRRDEAMLRERAAFVRGDCEWWKFTWPLHSERKTSAKIVVPYRARENRFAVDDDAQYLCLTDTTVLFDGEQPEDLHYIATVLNSRALTFRFRYIGKLVGGGTYEYFHNTVAKLVIPRRSPGDADHDRLAQVGKLITSHKEDMGSTQVPAERGASADEIARLEDLAEDLVSEMFGLSAADREIIEAELEAGDAAS